MQCRILVAFAVSCLMLSVAAAPIADSSILDRTPEPVEIERAPEPEPRCRLYTCNGRRKPPTNTIVFAQPLRIADLSATHQYQPSYRLFQGFDTIVFDALEYFIRAVTVSPPCFSI
ncbi:hypothetical protein C8R45DRAFT_1134597 [Mycena sanguinolenta]|nr:hypothetical protein C8R45DRAFT_1134597 [Mycena sanguinolenta]